MPTKPPTRKKPGPKPKPAAERVTKVGVSLDPKSMRRMAALMKKLRIKTRAALFQRLLRDSAEKLGLLDD